MGSLVTFPAPLTTTLAVNATTTVPYPNGFSQAALTNSTGGQIAINDNEVFHQGINVAFTFGASSITIQNLSPIDWPAGTIMNIGLSRTNHRGSTNLILGTRPTEAASGANVVPAPYPAPAGFRWGYVTENSIIVTENGSPVVELERAA